MLHTYRTDVFFKEKRKKIKCFKTARENKISARKVL